MPDDWSDDDTEDRHELNARVHIACHVRGYREDKHAGHISRHPAYTTGLIKGRLDLRRCDRDDSHERISVSEAIARCASVPIESMDESSSVLRAVCMCVWLRTIVHPAVVMLDEEAEGKVLWKVGIFNFIHGLLLREMIQKRKELPIGSSLISRGRPICRRSPTTGEARCSGQFSAGATHPRAPSGQLSTRTIPDLAVSSPEQRGPALAGRRRGCVGDARNIRKTRSSSSIVESCAQLERCPGHGRAPSEHR